jgi:hypothetical protein
MKLSRILFVLMGFYAVNCFAQDIKWTRIEFEKTVSVSVPEGFLVDMEKQNVFVSQKLSVFSSNGDFWFSLKIRDYVNPKRSVIGYRADSNDSERFSSDQAVAKRLIFNKGSFIENKILIGTKRTYYEFNIRIPNNGQARVLALKLIDSIKLGEKTPFPQSIEKADVTTVLLESDLKTSPEVLAAYRREFVENEDFTRVMTATEIINLQKAENREFSRQVILIDNRFGVAKDRIGQNITLKGKILVAALFKADGSLGEIKAFYTSDEKTAKAVIKEGKKTKFIPAQVSGKKVDSFHFQLIDLDLLGDKNLIR